MSGPVFVYTFNHHNINDVDEVARRVTGEGHPVTFNVFSAPQQSAELSSHGRCIGQDANEDDRDDGALSESGVVLVLQRGSSHEPQQPGRVVRLHLPARATDGGPGARRSGRYVPELSHGPDAFAGERLLRAGHRLRGLSALCGRKRDRFLAVARSRPIEQSFRAWLDYVDTYLSVWVIGYKKGRNLYRPSEEGMLPAIAQTAKAQAADGGQFRVL